VLDGGPDPRQWAIAGDMSRHYAKTAELIQLPFGVAVEWAR